MLTNQSVKNKKPQVKAATKTQGKENQDISNSTTFAESKAREELPGSKARYEKGMELYKQGKVSIVGDGRFKVSGYHEVDTHRMTCTCPDYKVHKQPCKHIFSCLLFTKNRGKQKIEDLNGHSSNDTCVSTPEPKEHSNKPQEAHSKELDRQHTITRLAVINSAIEALKTHRKAIEYSDIISLAAQLEQWARGN